MNFREKEELLNQLEEKSYEEELDESELNILNELSYDEEVYIRAVVAEILVESSNEKGEQILLRLTKDYAWLVRAEACDSLCISESAETYYLLKNIAEKDRSGCVRGYAIMSLGDIVGRIHMENELIEFLEDRLINEKVQFTKINIYTILYSLGRKEYLNNLLSMINSKRYQNRHAVVYSLNEIVNEHNKEVILTALLEHKKIETAWSVISKINEVIEEIENKEKKELLNFLEEKSYEEELDESELNILNELSYDEDDCIRAAVARILVESNDDIGEKILLRLAKDYDTLVRTEACDSLCISESAVTYDLLKKIASKDRSGMVRGYAIISLGDIADRINMEDDLIKFLETRLINEKVQFTIINIYTVLYNLGVKAYLTKLLLMINTKRYQNRCAVANCLNEIVNDSNKEIIIATLLERKKIEKSWAVVSTIDSVIEEIQTD